MGAFEDFIKEAGTGSMFKDFSNDIPLATNEAYWAEGILQSKANAFSEVHKELFCKSFNDAKKIFEMFAEYCLEDELTKAIVISYGSLEIEVADSGDFYIIFRLNNGFEVCVEELSLTYKDPIQILSFMETYLKSIAQKYSSK
ncbi:hypothetical protein AGMMS49975_13980 [Clostridia bacterium]|nr:hypothetical protein AGMMS49975_13980 [Clostridia bacterium]